MLQGNKRMAMASPVLDPPPRTTRMFPRGWAVVGLAVVLCLSLRMTSTGLLVAAVPREGGRVVACRYFTGAHVVERQHVAGASRADRHVSCPLIKGPLRHPVLAGITPITGRRAAGAAAAGLAVPAGATMRPAAA